MRRACTRIDSEIVVQSSVQPASAAWTSNIVATQLASAASFSTLSAKPCVRDQNGRNLGKVTEMKIVLRNVEGLVSMKPPIRIKMSRIDATVDSKQVDVPKSSWLGHSRGVLRVGDFFVFRESDTDSVKLARMHYRLAYAPQIGNDPPATGMIVAQVAHISMTFSMERWVKPEWVIETIPSVVMDEHIRAWFEARIRLNR
jgi:hypothetical protein